MIEVLQAFAHWIGSHSDVVGLGIFLIAMSESLAVVGLVIPGAAMMFGAGALVATGALEFWPILAWAVAGAIAGDSISFWLGHHYRNRLRVVWPFQSHPEWLARGESFFRRHGGKSILIGRFVGPVRPVIPVVAGMMGMRPTAFYGVNVLSALAWAPAYLLPGMAFGASLALARQVATRLAVLLGLVTASLWFVVWFIRWTYRVVHPKAATLAERVLAWSRAHPAVEKLAAGLLDPHQPESRALLGMAALLIAAVWGFLGILEDVVTGDPLVRVDQGMYHLMLGLRTPWGDQVMTLLTELGDTAVIVSLTLSLLGFLLWRRRWRTSAYWLAAVGFGELAVALLKLALHLPRPIEVYSGLSAYSFPSGHATMSVVVYGFLAVMVARDVTPQRRWVPYSLAGLLIGAIALSRLYLGAHWLSDVLGGLTLGLAWVSLLAIAYQRHPSPGLPARGLCTIALVAFVLAGAWHVSEKHAFDMQRYAPRYATRHMDTRAWWERDWQTLPAYRLDLEGEFEQPFNVQYAGPLDGLRTHLEARGWRQPVSLNIATALRWLLPAPALSDLPILPQVNEGRHEALLMVAALQAGRDGAATSKNPHLILRLWPADVVLGRHDVPLWVGNVSRQTLDHILFIDLPHTEEEFDSPLGSLEASLDGLAWRRARRPSGDIQPRAHWSGDVLLLQNSRLHADDEAYRQPILKPFPPLGQAIPSALYPAYNYPCDQKRVTHVHQS